LGGFGGHNGEKEWSENGFLALNYNFLKKIKI